MNILNRPDVKGIIFDLDGTLLDTLEDIAWCMNNCLNELGYQMHPVSEYRHMVGSGMSKLVEKVLPESANLEAIKNGLLRNMNECYKKNWNRLTAPYDGINEMLEELKKRNIPCAVHSNKPHEFASLMVDYFFPKNIFFMVQGKNDRFPLKPDPAGALAIAARAGIEPGLFLYTGDSDIDIYTAKAAGMRSAGAVWGFRGKKELVKAGAEVLLERPFDIFRYLPS